MNIDFSLETLVTSLSYNRDDLYLIDCLKATYNRIFRTDKYKIYDEEVGSSDGAGNDDVDILAGFCVCSAGDYGTSPRYGWIDEENQEEIKKTLTDIINDEIQSFFFVNNIYDNKTIDAAIENDEDLSKYRKEK